ncbi:uncharacterized protein AB9W97_016759 isoform 2-T2 [Spinachia spinachia]
MAHFYRLGLLVLLMIISECKDISTVTVITSKEEDTVLPCFGSYVMDPKGCYRFKLIKYATDSSLLKCWLIPAKPTTTKLQDAKSGKWEVNGNEQVSFCLKKTQLSDEGLYGCEIWKGWHCILKKNIYLKVRDCKNLPAVKANANASVNLHVPVDNISGVPGPQNISWLNVILGNAVSLNSARFEMNGTSLAIQSVQPSDSGWYRCNYVLGQTQRCFEMNLLVKGLEISETIWHTETVTEGETETETERSSGAFLPVVLTSVIIAAAITAALIGLFIYRRLNSPRVTQQTHRRTPPDRTNQDNPLYEQFLDESLHTFQY